MPAIPHAQLSMLDPKNFSKNMCNAQILCINKIRALFSSYHESYARYQHKNVYVYFKLHKSERNWKIFSRDRFLIQFSSHCAVEKIGRMLKTLQLLLGAFCCSEYFVPRPVHQPSEIIAQVSQRNFIDPHFLPNHYGIVQLFEWKVKKLKIAKNL